jgi:hypothetical protein
MASKRVEQEARIELAIKALADGQIATPNAAALIYGVPRTTLLRRRKGKSARHETRANSMILTQQEEDVLAEWILRMDRQGFSPPCPYVRRKANLLLVERVRGTTTSPPIIGKNWVTKFINRRPDLRGSYSRRYDHQRALCEDPIVIEEWFRLVRNVVSKYGIVADDMYNFDETGFQMGVSATARVITGSERRGKPLKKQPGNREWVTVIETISAVGIRLDPLIIFSGKVHQQQWFEALHSSEYRHWQLAVSDTGWTNDQIGQH